MSPAEDRLYECNDKIRPLNNELELKIANLETQLAEVKTDNELLKSGLDPQKVAETGRAVVDLCSKNEELKIKISDLETRLAGVKALCKKYYDLLPKGMMTDTQCFELAKEYWDVMGEKATSTPAPSVEIPKRGMTLDEMRKKYPEQWKEAIDNLVREKAKPLVGILNEVLSTCRSETITTFDWKLWKRKAEEIMRQFGKEKCEHKPVTDEEAVKHSCCQNCGDVRKEG